MDSHQPPSRPSLKDALGLAGARASAAASSSAGTGTTGAAGTAGGEDAAAGLGVDEYVDPLADPGRDRSQHSETKHLPGNALNMVEMFHLRERNHLLVQQSARRSGDRRTVRLDAVGLELFQQMQREVERAHFSQAAVSTKGKPKDPTDEIFADRRPEDIHQRHDEASVDVWQAGATLPDEGNASLDSDPDRPMTSIARERAALQREVLLELCAEAHEEALGALARLNEAEGQSTELRGRQASDRDDGKLQQDSARELRADGAEEFEARARQQFEVSHARAVQIAGAVQGRRIGLNSMLRDRLPTAPR